MNAFAIPFEVSYLQVEAVMCWQASIVMGFFYYAYNSLLSEIVLVRVPAMQVLHYLDTTVWMHKKLTAVQHISLFLFISIANSSYSE